MKKTDYIVMGLAGLAVWMIVRASGGGMVRDKGANFKPTPTAADQGFGNLTATWEGWRYYDSGYGRGPDGSIYYQGQKIA